MKALSIRRLFVVVQEALKKWPKIRGSRKGFSVWTIDHRQLAQAFGKIQRLNDVKLGGEVLVEGK